VRGTHATESQSMQSEFFIGLLHCEQMFDTHNRLRYLCLRT